jgi:hypothetical protein
MKILNEIRIGSRLGTGFGIISFLLCLTGAMAVIETSHVYRGTEQLATNWLVGVQTLAELRSAAETVRQTTQGALLAADPGEKQAARK